MIHRCTFSMHRSAHSKNVLLLIVVYAACLCIHFPRSVRDAQNSWSRGKHGSEAINLCVFVLIHLLPIQMHIQYLAYSRLVLCSSIRTMLHNFHVVKSATCTTREYLQCQFRGNSGECTQLSTAQCIRFHFPNDPSTNKKPNAISSDMWPIECIICITRC